MKPIVIGSDHAGFPLKEALKKFLADTYKVIDVGTYSEASVDYPDFAEKVGDAIIAGKAHSGILICGSGVGASVAANKIKGIRAGLCHDHYSAHQGVEHDDMNVLVLGARVIGIATAQDLVGSYLSAKFTREARHVRRLAKVKALEAHFNRLTETESQERPRERRLMAEQVYLAVDLGAESGRVMAGLWDGSQLRLEPVHRFPNEPVEMGNGLHWDVARLWLEIQNGLTAAARTYGQRIVSVGVDTWGVDFVLLSKSSELLGQPYHYRDRRTRGMMEAAFARMPRADIFAATGLQFMELNTLYQLLALQKNSPELLAEADCLLMMPDYLHWCLSGVRVSEFTIATTSQLFHPAKGAWSRELLERFNLPAKIFPQIVRPGARVGGLRDSVSAKTGLGNIAVTAPAAHDTGSAVAAVPTTHTGRANWAYLSSGTWSLMGVEVQEARISPRVLELNLTNEGGVDGTYRLLKNIMGLWLVQQCRRAFEARGKKLDYAELMPLAAAERPLVSLVDPNDQSFLNPPDMPRAIQDFCRETGQPAPQTEGALVRCALESLALAYQSAVAALEEVTGTRIEVIHIIGGGSRNDLLNQFTADACGRPVLAGPVEATALGNLLVQARGCGQIGSLAEIRSIVARSSEVKNFEPAAVRADEWQQAQGRFKELGQRRIAG